MSEPAYQPGDWVVTSIRGCGLCRMTAQLVRPAGVLGDWVMDRGWSVEPTYRITSGRWIERPATPDEIAQVCMCADQPDG